MTKVGFHPAAGLELRETASYYEHHVAGLGKEFLAEVDVCALCLPSIPLSERRTMSGTGVLYLDASRSP